jgi:hypothetical protein
MGGLFSKPDIPEPKLPPPPKVQDQALENAERAERIRRLRAIGKQQSIFAGETATGVKTLSPTLG